jgi:sulfoxide reductase heme-binding subunit YedZ
VTTSVIGDRRTLLLRLGGWRARHLLVIAFGALAVYLFWESRPDWSPMHRWNRSFGDASLVLIAVAMAIGPLARFWSAMRRAVPWRRELGIWGVVLMGVHTFIIFAGWFEWDLMRFFGFQFHPQLDRYVMVQHGFGLANLIGIVALFYGAILALTSNNYSQRVLGGAVWKFFQQGTYVLWMLIVLHTAYFLYLHFQDFHRPTPEPNWTQWPFVALVLGVLALQVLASWKVWRTRQRNTAVASA